MKVALKYCGSCNPDVDVGETGRRLRILLKDRVALVSLASDEADLVVILNGCLVACADREDVRAKARGAIVVAGTSVALRPVPDGQVAERVAEMIMEMAKALTGA